MNAPAWLKVIGRLMSMIDQAPAHDVHPIPVSSVPLAPLTAPVTTFLLSLAGATAIMPACPIRQGSAMLTATASTSERADFLDWLRVIAIGFLLLYHTGMLFVGWGWHIENAETASVLQLPMAIAHRLRMPLLFVIAGASIYFALRRRSAAQVLFERSKRLLLPLLAGIVLIVPPQLYLERLFRQQWSGDYLSFFSERVMQLQPYPQGDLSWHHLWFIAYLFVYCLLLVPLFARWRKRSCTLKPGHWLYALGLILGVNEAILKPLFPETHNLISDWYTFNHYAVLFIFGFMLSWLPGSWNWLQQQRRCSLLLGALLALVFAGLREAGQLPGEGTAEAVLANLFTWVWLLVFLGYGKQWLSFSNASLQYLRQASYPVYILHQTVIILLGYLVIQQPWAWQAKYLVILVLTVLICFGLYECLIRRWGLLRVVFGLKMQSQPI